MNELTREELLNIIETDHVQCGEASALARMALAAMDSEPVAYTDERNLGYIDRGRETAYLWGRQNSEAGDVPLYRHAQPAKGLELAGWQFKSVNGDWLGLIDEHGKNQAVREGCEVREVFAMADGVNERGQVRHAQQQVVPEEIKHRIGGLDWGWEGEFNRGWNACRAAMLQAGNSPLIPDRWIPVSERMPENDVSVLTFDGMYKRVHHTMYGHWQCWEPEKITHWMPLPAAPQEVRDGK